MNWAGSLTSNRKCLKSQRSLSGEVKIPKPEGSELYGNLQWNHHHPKHIWIGKTIRYAGRIQEEKIGQGVPSMREVRLPGAAQTPVYNTRKQSGESGCISDRNVCSWAHVCLNPISQAFSPGLLVGGKKMQSLRSMVLNWQQWTSSLLHSSGRQLIAL